MMEAVHAAAPFVVVQVWYIGVQMINKVKKISL
jgi:hypothetical protein